MAQNNYRPDINGLRAIAVIAVILNHFDKTMLPLGHLGVDIFFVVSGFVITSSLYHRNDSGIFIFWKEFYARRFKRLFPALAACVLITSVLISMVDPSPVASLRTGLSALLGLSNMYLLKQATDYFGVWANSNAFTHTWSLGVEEQFYLVFPLAIWATGFRLKSVVALRKFIAVMGVASAISIVFYIAISTKSQPLSFFLLPSRLWEIGVGGVLFAATALRAPVVRLMQIVPSGLSLASLVALLCLPIEAEVPATIAVVALSALLIAALSPSALAYHLLTQPTMQYLGRISYSLYLWHWSVICLSRWTVGLSWWLAPFQFALIILLAAASYHLLEKPLRERRWSRSQPKALSCGLLSISGVALAIVLLLDSGHKHFYLGAPRPMVTEAVPQLSPLRGTLLLVGDSHAGHFASLAANISSQLGLRYISVTDGATPFPTTLIASPVGGLTIERTRRTSASLERRLEEAVAVLDDREENIIILSSFYRFYFEPLLGGRKYQVMTHYDATGHQISAEQSLERWLNRLKKFASKQHRTRIVVILSTPEMPDLYPEVMCQREWFRPTPSDKCYVEVDRKKTIALLSTLNSRIIQAVGQLPNVSIFDPMPALCPEWQEVCRSHDRDGRLFADEDHLTAVGARRMEDALLAILSSSELGR